jgi:hypothetical protein
MNTPCSAQHPGLFDGEGSTPDVVVKPPLPVLSSQGQFRRRNARRARRRLVGDPSRVSCRRAHRGCIRFGFGAGPGTRRYPRAHVRLPSPNHFSEAGE